METTVVIGTVVLMATLVAIWLVIKLRWIDRRVAEAERVAQEVMETAQKEAEQVKKIQLLEARDQIFNWRSEAEKETQSRRQELSVLDRRLASREDNLQRKEQSIFRKESDVERRLKELRREEEAVSERNEELKNLVDEQAKRLEEISSMTAEEAKRVLVKSIEDEAFHEATVLARRIEEDTKKNAEQEARKIVSQAIQRCAAEHVVESTVSVVQLPSDDMKGRIIGREGRNIRALEKATGVNLIVDDAPEAVTLSGFDPLRREVAKLSIEKLIEDGRIHPTRIEEVVRKVEEGMDDKILQAGEEVVSGLGIQDIHPELTRLVGRLKYRTSYGQNILYHSREVAYLAGIMGRELGVDVEVCKRGGLLHDIGKVVDRDMEGTHLELGVKLVQKYGESPEVIHAVEAHHFDVEFRTIEAVLVQAADAISSARPGARREVLESYIKRLEKLEEIAASFSGVTKTFALQAGREVRIIVESSQVSDERAFWLTKEIAKKIENELQYPGQVKVTLIREMRVVDYAK